MICFHGYPCLCHKNHGHDRQQATDIHIKLAGVKLDIHAIWEIHRHWIHGFVPHMYLVPGIGLRLDPQDAHWCGRAWILNGQ